ncbi:MAG TPA: NADH-quinone oxidoreductase subunit NuoF [Candidatus Binataceae bacterium]|nr:NADH-quinone oxidoreductase subunit NuoF [Candidatus Binataceae bacterium]
MSTRIYLSRDSGALSVGAEAVARGLSEEAARRGIEIELIRTGSRGLYWLEPLVEVEGARGRIAYGPVTPGAISELLSALFAGGDHPLLLGPTEQLPYLARQERLTFARVGVIDPLSVSDYLAHGGYRGLRRALELSADQIVAEVIDSGLRGRGGAGFPCGVKWRTALAAPGARKYVVCNADEGDSGTFADRMLMEGDPLTLIEGMTIAGLAIGATQGYIYLRSEYPHAAAILEQALAGARAGGYLGGDLMGSGRRFDLELRVGAGAYICGEETALLESLEGKRGMVRYKPPLPAIHGLFGQPTAINNVLTLASVPLILERGGKFYQEYGSGRSRGTQPIQLAGNVRRPGLIEKAFGISLREIVYDFGGGTASGRPLRAVQVGGPLGAYLPEALLDTPLDYEALAEVGGLLGHGGIVVFDDTVDMAAMARYAMEFCAVESCGKCTPCRIGSTRGVEILDAIIAGRHRPDQFALLEELCATMEAASLCALGGLTPLPVRSAIRHFPADFGLERAPQLT